MKYRFVPHVVPQIKSMHKRSRLSKNCTSSILFHPVSSETQDALNILSISLNIKYNDEKHVYPSAC